VSSDQSLAVESSQRQRLKLYARHGDDPSELPSETPSELRNCVLCVIVSMCNCMFVLLSI
jgi:hypothetical protein